MRSTAITRFFGVVKRPQTWLTFAFNWLAFPLGLFYFIFLVVGLSLGIGLLVVWVGIPVLLVVAGAWWLFGSFERMQAKHMLGADVGPAPRSWETVDGVWGKLKAHFGNGYTWRDLVYLLAKLPFGIVSFTLVVTLVALVGWLGSFPIGWYKQIQWLSWGQNGGLTPTWWEAVLSVPAAILLFIVALHIQNGWGWICARWAELVFGRASQQPFVAASEAATPVAPPPLVSTGPAPQASAAPMSAAPMSAAPVWGGQAPLPWAGAPAPADGSTAAQPALAESAALQPAPGVAVASAMLPAATAWPAPTPPAPPQQTPPATAAAQPLVNPAAALPAQTAPYPMPAPAPFEAPAAPDDSPGSDRSVEVEK